MGARATGAGPEPISTQSLRDAGGTGSPLQELRREFLDLEVQAVHRWLTALALLLPAMGVVPSFTGFFGFRRLRDIEREAQGTLTGIQACEGEARRRVENIGITAESAPEEAFVKCLNDCQVAADAPVANPVAIAAKEALALQKVGWIEEMRVRANLSCSSALRLLTDA